MNTPVRVVVFCLGISYACSCRYVTDPGGLDGSTGDPIGTLTFVTDTVTFTTYQAVARQVSVSDALVSQRLEGSGQGAYFDARMRSITTNSTVVLLSLVIRFGDVDSTAQSYELRIQSILFSSSFGMSEGGIIEGTFSGLLDGTGPNALGKTLQIRKGKIRVPWTLPAAP